MGGVIEREKDLAKWHSAADTKIKAISNCMTKYSRQAKKQWKKKRTDWAIILWKCSKIGILGYLILHRYPNNECWWLEDLLSEPQLGY